MFIFNVYVDYFLALATNKIGLMAGDSDQFRILELILQ